MFLFQEPNHDQLYLLKKYIIHNLNAWNPTLGENKC